MYELMIQVDELNVGMSYTTFERALLEFKECVEELMKRSQPDDDMIMKINGDYALFIVQSEDFNYKLELQSKKGVK